MFTIDTFNLGSHLGEKSGLAISFLTTTLLRPPIRSVWRRLCAARSCAAQGPALIPGRPLGGPVVHRTTGSSASPFQPARRSVSYAFAVFRPCGLPDRRLGALATGSGEKSGLDRSAVRLFCEIVHRPAPGIALQPAHRITESVTRGVVKASRIHSRWQATGLAGTERRDRHAGASRPIWQGIACLIDWTSVAPGNRRPSARCE